MVQPTEFALIVAAARKEVEKALASKDRAALEAFAPSFAIKDGHLFMSHAGAVADLGNVIGPRGMDGFHGRDGKSIKGDKGDPGRDGVDGKSIVGPKGDPGPKGEPGQNGEDGVSVADAYVSETGHLIIQLSDGRKITAGHVRGRDGKDGKDAKGKPVFWGAGSTSGGGGGATNLGWNAATSTVTSDTGTDATLTLADAVNAGLMSAADKAKLDGIEAGAQVNVPTDLSYTAGTRVLASSTGADATLPLFTSADAGLVPASGGGTTNFLRADGTFAAPPGGGGSPGGATGEVQWNNAGAFAGAADVEIEGGQLRLPAIAAPTAPAASGLKLINWSRIGQPDALAAMFPDGRIVRAQGDLAEFQDFRFVPTVGATSVTGDGTLPVVATGTATGIFTGTANIWEKMPRIDARVTTASATAVAGFRRNQVFFTAGRAAAAPGGFYAAILWGPGRDYVLPSTHRACCGVLTDVGAPTDVQPSSLVNGIWMGWDAADANVQMMHNDGTGTATKIDLGASFPVPGATVIEVYLLELYSPNSLTQAVQYRVTLLNTTAKTAAQTATGTITTNLPSVTTMLAPRVWCSVGGTSSQVSTSLFGMHIRTEY